MQQQASAATAEKGELFEYAIRQPVSLNRGEAALVPIVRGAVGAGVPVVVTSRCPTGRVEPIYGKGGGKDLADAGAIFAGDLKGPKARLLLMVLLAAPGTRDRIAATLAELAP